MNREHYCQVSTARAVRLQILDSILDTPRALLSGRFSDAELQRVGDEAQALEDELKSAGRCRDCGGELPRRPSSRMADELAYVWGV